MASVDLWRYKRLVQAFWDPELKNDDSSASCIWCLGKEYKPRNLVDGARDSTNQEVPAPSDGEGLHQDLTKMKHAAMNSILEVEQQSLVNEVDRGWPPKFVDDSESRIWFTYRSNFPAIKKSSDALMTLSVRLRSLGDQGGFTSDTGWGCMIRSGQSLLANALVMQRFGRGKHIIYTKPYCANNRVDWRRGSNQDEERQLLSLFADDPRAPFSIHRFVEHGASACGKHPGEWFGPSATARCIQ